MHDLVITTQRWGAVLGTVMVKKKLGNTSLGHALQLHV